MVGVQKLEHVSLTVDDLEQSLQFYTEVMGLSELDRDGDTVYLTCGYDGNYDLAIREGEPKLNHFSIRVDDETELDEHIKILKQNNVAFEDVDTAEPGQRRGVRVTLPSGPTLELVGVENTAYRKDTQERVAVNGIGPIDVDHVNLMSPRVKDDVEFLTTNLGFLTSDVFNPGPVWAGAWVRYGDYHHDIAFNHTEDEGQSLHHVAWTVNDISHQKQLCDAIARAGYELELGISRHDVGNNLFAYFWTPGGHRVELSTELATLDENTEPAYHEDSADVLTAWGGITRPDSFDIGS